MNYTGEIPGRCFGFNAGEDLEDKRYYAVKMNTNGDVVLAGDGESAIGIIRFGDDHDRRVNVCTSGIIFGILGGAVATPGLNVASDAAGKIVTAGGGDAILGVSLASGTTNDIIPILLVTRATAGSLGIAKGYTTYQFPVTLTAADDAVLASFVPGFIGTIEKIEWLTTTAATTANKTAALSMKIGAAPTVGGVLSLTTATVDTIGDRVAMTAITDDNGFVATDVLSLVAANTAVPFIEGAGIVIITLSY